MMWDNTRVFVTGGSGFIGSALISHLLDRGAQVHALVLDEWGLPVHRSDYRLTAHRGDITDAEAVRWAITRADPQAVFHLAAVTQVEEAAADPLHTYRVNVQGTVNLLEAVRRAPGIETTVIASSDKAYGPQVEPVTKDTPFMPAHPYDASKAAADMIAHSYGRHYDVPVGVMRTANVWGPGDRNLRRIIPGTIYSALHGRAPVLRSDGTPVWEYLHIRDCVLAYIELAEAVLDSGGGLPLVSLVGGERISVADLADKILAVMGSSLRPIVARTARQETQSVNIVPNVLLPGMVTLDQGLPATVVWARQQWFKVP